MYDEKIDCKLRTSALVEDRILNWSRINSQICFNFLQQRFYLVEPTMKSLAKGNNSDTIFKLLKVLINTQQADFYEALAGDTSLLKDIADQLEVDPVSRNSIVVEVEGKRIEVSIPERFLHTGTGSPTAGRAPRRKVSSHHASAGAQSGFIKAPMQSTVVKLAVKVGDKVVEGDQVLVLEAMKMEQSITSPRAGLVKAIKVSVGETIASGTVLIEFED